MPSAQRTPYPGWVVDIVRLAREHSDVTPEQLVRLRRLAADWSVIADLAMADLVLWVPTWNGGGYVAVAHQRPDTARTCFAHDVVGTFTARGRRPVMDMVMASARPQQATSSAGGFRQQIYPLLGDAGAVFALMGRYTTRDAGDAGRLARAYQQTADELCEMVSAGAFAPTDRSTEPPLRVGGGMIRLDAAGVVTYASPNAVSAFRRLGVSVDLPGASLARLALRLHDRPDGADPDVARVAAGKVSGRVELVHGDATAVLESIPLVSGDRPTGALLLVRDVTELRHRERDLLTTEASLREVHHRIKNNLQMVAALLRLQSRRVDSEEARGALVDAGSRIGAIAGVHEVLAANPGSSVDFDEVIDRVLAMARELAPGSTLTRIGSAGPWPSQTATTAAMCLAELVGNAVEHSGGTAAVSVRVRVTGDRAELVVEDDGPGLPAGFTPEASGRLGLQIVQTLVTENGGEVQWTNRGGGGTSVTVSMRKTLTAQDNSRVR